MLVEKHSGRVRRPALLCAVSLLAAAFPAMAQDTESQDLDNEVTEVLGVTISATGIPVPDVGEGAPLFTPAMIREKRDQGRQDNSYYTRNRERLYECYIEAYEVPPNYERLQGYDLAIDASQRLRSFTVSAEQLTNEALEARIAFGRGEATREDIERTELARQEAVVRMMIAEADLQEAKAVALDIQALAHSRAPLDIWPGTIASNAALRNAAAQDPYQLVPLQYRDLALEELQVAERVTESGETALMVRGAIRNTRTNSIPAPPIAVTAVDEFGFALQSETAAGRSRIEPGQAMPFAYELNPSPALSHTVLVTFADPARPSFLLPAGADPVCSGLAPRELDPNRSGSRRSIEPSVRTYVTHPR